MEITGEYWRSERCGLLLAKPCCSTLGLARYLLWSVYDVRLIIVQTASAQFATKKRSRLRLLEDTLFQKIALMFQRVQIITKCCQVCDLQRNQIDVSGHRAGDLLGCVSISGLDFMS